jgi:uncharacterized lipoprotein YajG
MKSTNVLSQLTAVGIAAALLTTGCSTIKVGPGYTTTTKGPLADLPSVTVGLKVTDQRPDAERQVVGHLYNNFGGLAVTFIATNPIPQVIFDAIQSDFEVNGHHVVPAGQPAQANMEVTLKRFFYECKPHMWDVEVVTSVQTDVKVERPPGGATPSQFELSSTFRKSRQIVGRGSHEKLINQGLEEYLRILGLDPGLREAFGVKP